MKIQNDIQFRAIFLLLIYIIGISPLFLIHHHNSKIPSYTEATPCEKAVYYSDLASDPNHSTHVSKATDKCWLCDHHTVSPHSIRTLINDFIHKNYTGIYASNILEYFLQIGSTLSDRGPPSFSSLIM